MSASNKSLLFLLGLVLGLLAGAGFFIFKMDGMLEKVNLFSSSRDTVIVQQANTEEKKGKTDIKKYIGKKDTSKHNMSSAELLAQKYSREVPIRKVMAEADSLLKDSSTIIQEQNTSENFIVRKDELLDSKNLQVVNLQNEEKINPSDSLLEKVSGIKNNKSSSSLKVEFWQSPINYKGYKMTKNKVVLFAINPDENIKLFHLDDDIFMKHNQNYYKLYFTDDFKQFEKVTDATITNKLK